MGETQVFQPLTREDRITVTLYRVGIVLSAVIMIASCLLGAASPNFSAGHFDVLIYGLYVSVGMSVFFIHLYIGSFKTYLKMLYYAGLVCLVLLFLLGKGSPAAALASGPFGPLLLLPLAGCLGFVTAKEAFCFKLFEGYLLAMVMPAYLVLVSAGALSRGGVFSGLILITVLLAVFTLRKAFMPLAYDIGDKSAYH